MREPFHTLVVMGLRLRCPECEEGHLFEGRHRLRRRCEHCGTPFEKEPGQWVGALYFNLIPTELVVVGGFLLSELVIDVPFYVRLLFWTAAAVAFPIWFYPYSKGLWGALIHLTTEPQAPAPRPPVRDVFPDD